MAHILPALIAYLICISNVNIFVQYRIDQIDPLSPLLASQIIKSALYFVLLDIDLYKTSFRKINAILLFVYEVVIGILFIELVLCYGWFPLEKKILSLVPMLLKYFYYRCSPGSTPRTCIIYLSNNYFLMFVSYLISIISLCCVLHATRVLDFRIISCIGVGAFLRSIYRKIRKGMIQLLSQLNLSDSSYTVRQTCHAQQPQLRRRRSVRTVSYRDNNCRC